MAGRSSRQRGARSTAKATGDAPKRGAPTSGPRSGQTSEPTSATAGLQRARGRGEIFGGAALVVAGLVCAATVGGTAKYAAVYGLLGVGVLAIVVGAVRLAPATDPRLPPQRDVRRWIYGGLDLLFGVVYAIAIWKVIPNRLPTAAFHLWTLPIATLVMGAGTLIGGRYGWWTAIAGGSALLLSVIVLIARILISAAFLAGVYGAFGKAASTFAIVAVALIIEVVALLPIIQIKFLMTRAGRRAYGT